MFLVYCRGITGIIILVLYCYNLVYQLRFSNIDKNYIIHTHKLYQEKNYNIELSQQSFCPSCTTFKGRHVSLFQLNIQHFDP